MFTSSHLVDKVNSALNSVVYPKTPKGLYEPVSYVLSLGGKRIRPVLLLMAYNLYQSSVDDAIDAALGLETYHNYTLLHDDLMDRAEMRRGKTTVHKLWNENTAILSGDSMLVLTYRYMLDAVRKSGNPEILDVFTTTALEIGEGQQLDMNFEQRSDVSEGEYIEMIRLKTSVLLACALKIGAIMGGADKSDADILYRFGEQVGLAFQLQDDYLDVYGNTENFGKKIGGDILCNKKTFLLINAYNSANEKQRELLEYWISTEDSNPKEKIEAVTNIYNEIGVKEVSNNKVTEYFKEAEQTLSKISLPTEKTVELWSFVKSLMNRTC